MPIAVGFVSFRTFNNALTPSQRAYERTKFRSPVNDTFLAGTFGFQTLEKCEQVTPTVRRSLLVFVFFNDAVNGMTDIVGSYDKYLLYLM